MRAVANGDLNHPIAMTSKDEIGEMAREFDRMTAELHETLMQKQQLNTEVKMHEMAEDEIHRAQELTRQWLNSCTDGVWDWYLIDDYEYMSPRFWELFGIDPDTKQHRPSEWQEILHPDDVRKVTQGFEKHVASKGAEPFREELRFQHKDGHTIWVLNRGQVIEWHSDGSPKRMVGTHTDITRQKEGDRLSPEGREYLDIMKSGALRMQNLIRDLLNLSRIATHAVPFEPVDLNAVCETVLVDLALAIEESGGHVHVADLPTVNADPSQMRQLLQNLMSNALKFRRADTPLEVHLASESPSSTGQRSARCGFYVQDNGIGFNNEDSERIFGVFQRLHAKQAYPGSGIGLAICGKITERHDGKISVDSKPGVGTVFHVELPTRKGENPTA